MFIRCRQGDRSVRYRDEWRETYRLHRAYRVAMWFAAHAIFYYKLRGRRTQSLYVVHENVYLINARNEASARKKAERVVKEVVSVDDPTMTVDNHPASYEFVGFRKMQKVWNYPEDVLQTGDEATFHCYHVNTVRQVRRLARGERANVLKVV